MKKEITKRKWRRIRGKIIAKDRRLFRLRKVEYSTRIMTVLVEVFLKPPMPIHPQYDEFYFGE